MKVSPLSITTLAWPVVEVLPELPQRTADVKGFDLKTPLGQFQLLEHFTDTSRAASLMQVSVVISMTEFEQGLYSFIPDVKTILLDRWKDDQHVNMVAVIYTASLRDWHRLSKSADRIVIQLVREVRACTHPSKLWSYLDKCSNVF